MTDLLEDDGEEFSELVSAQFGRVDLVGRPANGVPFLIMKQAEDATGLLDPEFVRDLVAKADPETGTRSDEKADHVTMTGTPAAVAAFIHKAGQRQAGDGVAKAEMSSKSINDLPDSAFAFIEPGGKKDASGKTTPRSKRHFPVHDKAHADNAAARIAQGAKFGKEAAPKVHAAQRRFGEKVSKEEATVTETVSKDALGALDLDGITPDAGDLDNGTDGMDPTTPFADPGNLDDLPGDPDDPGSPAWEAIDAATAQKWTAILSRAKNALGLLSDRELLEAATVDPDDADNAYDLQDAQCALDFAIGTLAVFAAGEQAETDICTEAMEVSKALAGFDPAALAVVEGLVPVAKAGRVLSSANESALRSAAEAISKVLASLPQAPTADDQVTKEATVAEGTKTETPASDAEVAKAEETAPETVTKDAAATETQTAPDATPPAASEVTKADSLEVIVYGKDGEPGKVNGSKVTKCQAGQVAIFDQRNRFVSFVNPGQTVPVAKADTDAPAKPEQVAVYDSEGNLVGVADPADITPLANVKAPAKNQDDDDPAKPEDAKPADPADLAPAPSADAGTPASGAVDDDVAKATTETSAGEPADGTTSDEREVLKSLVTEAVTAAFGGQAPGEDIAKQADVIRGLSEQVETLKAQVVTLGEQPAMPKVFTNGATPPPGTLRGQDQGATAVDVAKAQEMRRQFLAADPAEQNRLAGEMQQGAINTLAALHGRPQ